MRIAFVIRALGMGGAERQLVALARGLALRGNQVVVFTLYPSLDDHEAALAAAGVLSVCIAKKSTWDVLGTLLRLYTGICKFAPDVIYSFLPTSNVLCAALLWPRRQSALVWGVRGTVMTSSVFTWVDNIIIRFEGMLRGAPDVVIANSKLGATECLRRGFPLSQVFSIRNSIDADVFCFDPAARAGLRRDWRFLDDQCVIGVAGRVDPLKGFEILIDAFDIAVQTGSTQVLVVAGEGSASYVAELKSRIDSRGLSGRVIWLGRVTNMSAFYSAIDLLCSASFREGTSNVIAEALAVGTCCVVTSVGDSAELVTSDCIVVKPGSAEELSGALLQAKVFAMDEKMRSGRRDHVVRLLGVERSVVETENLLKVAVRLHRRVVNIRGAD
jgi:glycosyltransferase involved in cell wall biosynthesis